MKAFGDTDSGEKRKEGSRVGWEEVLSEIEIAAPARLC